MEKWKSAAGEGCRPAGAAVPTESGAPPEPGPAEMGTGTKKPAGCGRQTAGENGIMRWVWQGRGPERARRERRDPASGGR